MKGRRNGTIKNIRNKAGTGTLTPYGYKLLTVGSRRILEHRYIMEQSIGRKLKPKEKVHHKDHNKLNNSLENLELMSGQSEHIKHYHSKQWKIDWSRVPVLPKTSRFHPYNMAHCIIVDCLLPTKTRGLCKKHATSYYRWCRKQV